METYRIIHHDDKHEEGFNRSIRIESVASTIESSVQRFKNSKALLAAIEWSIVERYLRIVEGEVISVASNKYHTERMSVRLELEPLGGFSDETGGEVNRGETSFSTVTFSGIRELIPDWGGAADDDYGFGIED